MKKVNKKIKNATPFMYDNIHFKSKLEVMTYKTLKEAGFAPQYEPHTYTLQKGFKSVIPYYRKTPKSKVMKTSNSFLPITYTPDIEVCYKGHTCVFEVKGFADAKFPLKRKMFLKYLEDNNLINYIYCEVHTKANVLQAIEIMKKL